MLRSSIRNRFWWIQVKKYLALMFFFLAASLQSQAQQFTIPVSDTLPQPVFTDSLRPVKPPNQQPTPAQESVYAEPTEEAEDESPVGDFTITYGYEFTDRPRNNPNGSRDMVGPFAFGVTLHPRFGVEIGFDTFLSTKEPGTPRVNGAGDMSLTATVNAFKAKGGRPSLSFIYTVIIPTASVEKGLGTGRVSHLIFASLSKPLGTDGENGTISATFGPNFFGRPGESGFITTGRLALSYNYGFANGFAYTGRAVGRTRGGGRASLGTTAHALSYKFNDRYGVEAGMLFGLTSNAPRAGFFTSFTVSGNLRRMFR